MIAETRRTVLTMLGISPVAAPFAATELRAVLASPSSKPPSSKLLMAAGTMANDAPCPPELCVGMPGVPATIFKQIDMLIRDCEGEMYRAERTRDGGLDADIAALKSVARVHKERKQAQRDNETVSLLNQARAYLYR